MPTTLRHKGRWTLCWLALAVGAPLATALYVALPASVPDGAPGFAEPGPAGSVNSELQSAVSWVCLAVTEDDRGSWPGELVATMSPQVLDAVARLPAGESEPAQAPVAYNLEE